MNWCTWTYSFISTGKVTRTTEFVTTDLKKKPKRNLYFLYWIYISLPYLNTSQQRFQSYNHSEPSRPLRVFRKVLPILANRAVDFTPKESNECCLLWDLQAGRPSENWYGNIQISTISWDMCFTQNICELSCWIKYQIKFSKTSKGKMLLRTSCRCLGAFSLFTLW